MSNKYKRPRVLFILKRREDFDADPSYSQTGLSTGLLNSATFMHDMLLDHGVESRLVVVVDNNCIDREVNNFKPTHVVIEALWVVPEKFNVLQELHPEVNWIVRYHSDAPFIANEGIAIQWTLQYLRDTNVTLALNSARFQDEVLHLCYANDIKTPEKRVIYLPNYYPVDGLRLPKKREKNVVNVGCFGAVRPLKNHLTQALAAIKFANNHKLALRFHINGNRVEGKGDPALKNLRALFKGLDSRRFSLIEHEWMPHDEFKDLLQEIDLGVQVSFSETFNIVAADLITSGVPVVGSDEIPWLKSGIASTTSSDDIANSMEIAWMFSWFNVVRNNRALKEYSDESAQIWYQYVCNSIPK